MDLETFRALLTPSGRALLAEVHDRAGIESDHALGARLRQSHDGDVVAAAVTVNHLRGIAADRIGPDAARMYFTHDSLRQITPTRVADHRAHRMRDLGVTRAVDLRCGVGGDLVSFARAGLAVRGIDIDPVRVEMARANLDALGLSGEVEVGDARDGYVVDGAVGDDAVGNDEVVFCRPDRPTGGRAARLDAMSPSWGLLADMLARRAVVAVHPDIAPSEPPPGVEAEWVGDTGSLVECCLWSAAVVGDHAGRRVTLLPGGDTIGGDGDTMPESSGPIGHFLVEPDAAVIRAGLSVELAATLGGRMLDPAMDWITTDERPHTPFGRTLEVVHEVPFRTAQLRVALSDRDIGEVSILAPGLPIVPQAVVAKLRLTGTRAATVVLTRVAGRGRAFIVDAAPAT